MNELLPIIRRKRRPLLPVEESVVQTAREDARPTETENIEHPTTNIEHPTVVSQSLVTSAATEDKSSDEKVTTKRNAR